MSEGLGNHFLALRPDRATEERLAAIVERLRDWELPAKWVHPLDYHLSLHFLGRLEAAEAHAVGWSVDELGRSLVAPHREPRLAGLGAFAGRRQPRVVFAALAEPASWIRDLHSDVHDALGEPAPEFTPHITLARPQAGNLPGGRDWPRLFEAFGQAEWGGCRFADLALLAADPMARPGQPRYRVLERWPVAGWATPS